MKERVTSLRIGQQVKIPGVLTMDLYGNPDVKHDCNVFPYPFADSRFKSIVMIEVLNHLTAEPEKVFAELYRITRGGGTIHISVPYWKDDVARHIWHHRQFRKEAFLDLDNSRVSVSQTFHGVEPPFRFRVARVWYERGSIRFWKKYMLNVIFEVVKK